MTALYLPKIFLFPTLPLNLEHRVSFILKQRLIKHLHAYAGSLSDISHLICYGMKANSNLAVLQILAKEGAGFDIVSIGELERVIKAGGDPAKVVFSGVGKQNFELRRALEVGIHCFNVESLAELEHLNTIAIEDGQNCTRVTTHQS